MQILLVVLLIIYFGLGLIAAVTEYISTVTAKGRFRAFLQSLLWAFAWPYACYRFYRTMLA